MTEISARPAERPILGVDSKTGGNIYQTEDGGVSRHSDSDMTASARVSEHLDAIEEYLPRLRSALARRAVEEARRRNVRPARTGTSHTLLVEALKVLHDAARALGETPESRSQMEAEREVSRVWSRAKDQYQRWAGAKRKGQDRILPFDMLSDQQRVEWFDRADDRVPPHWDGLTPKQRLVWAGGRDLPQAVVRPLYESARALDLRRRVYRRIEFANPYTVRGPQQRMEDVASFAQLLSYNRDEHARGYINDLELAVWEEHYRRALHAYTRPFEPYEAP